MVDNTKTWQGPDRRKKKSQKDPLFKLMVAGNIVAWLIFLVSLYIFHYARPEVEYGFYRYLGIASRSHWIIPLTNWLAVLLVLTLLFSLSSIWLHKKRARRAQDNLGVNLFILLVAALGGLVWVIAQLL